MRFSAAGRQIVFVCLFFGMSACGGGGGGSNPPPQSPPPTQSPPPPQSQTITFADAGPITRLVGSTFANPASGGAGTGSITYASSDASVAEVDADSGEVTVLGLGAAEITATKAADADYLEAQSSYDIESIAHTEATAWVSAADGSEFRFAAAADGAEFVRSNEPDCDLSQIGACSNGQSDVVAGTPIVDTTLDVETVAYHHLLSGSRTSERVVASVERFSPRVGHAAVRFSGRYWLIGGGTTSSGGNTVFQDVWASDDGTTWELIQDAPAFGPQWFHKLAVHDGHMWLFAPFSAWSSTDGVDWTLASQPTPFSSLVDLSVVTFQGELWAVHDGTAYASPDGEVWTARSAPGAAGNGRDHETLTVFANALWLIGGNDAGGAGSSEIWTSTDGVAWSLATDSGFPARTQHTSFVLDGQLWVLGGLAEAGGGAAVANGDAWFSTDGINWQAAATTAHLNRVFLAEAVVHDDTVKLIAGVRIGFSNQVWSSADGHDWSEQSPLSPFRSRFGARAAVFDDALWLVGGNEQVGGVSNEVWRSVDGRSWSQVALPANAITPTSSHGLAAHAGRLWAIGGWDGSADSGGTATVSNEIWSSADGGSWTLHDPGSVVFSARMGHTLTSFSGRLWLIGGQTSTGTVLGDIWSSADGESWTEETSNASFGPRASHAVLNYDGALWVLGGTDGAAAANDVWTTTDGTNWIEVSITGASWSPRLGHAATVHDNRMWLVGGTDSGTYDGGVQFNDVWWSNDGASWTEANAAATFGPRWTHQLVSRDDNLWLLTGFDRTLHDDVWRSADGVDWQVLFQTEFEFQ